MTRQRLLVLCLLGGRDTALAMARYRRTLD